MPLPSEVLCAMLLDLSSIAAVCLPNQALESARPAQSTAPFLTVSWPAMNEQPEQARQGMTQTGSDIGCVFVFAFETGLRDQSQGPQGAVLTPAALAAYDVGPKLRALFYNACRTRELAYSVVVGRVGQNPPAVSSSLQTYGGQFEITVRFQDDSHIRAYSPQSGGQPGQRP